MSGVEDPRVNSRIVAAYRARTTASADLNRQARDLLPSGIAHDARNLDPYSVYITRALGPHKWDVDGNRYMDYFGGHGALILGHSNPTVTEAATAAMAEGTQFGASHPREIAWARAIQRLVPSAERIRFTSSGTEATLMAVRLARAFTGREALLRFKGHFHGWHDHMTSGWANHFDGSPTPGVLPGIASSLVLATPGDEAEVARLLAPGDVAAVIIEPTGASFGQVPLRPEFLHFLRKVTERTGTLFIMDEVITGFRVSSGGAQVAFGVKPDLTSLAKIVAGGLPGAAVVGRRDILDLLDFAAAPKAGREKVGHQGTHNANPVSAAAGIAALEIIGSTDVCERAAAAAALVRDALNAVIVREGLPWAVYGTSSGFHFFLNAGKRAITPATFDPFDCTLEELKAQPQPLTSRLRLALLVNGVDVNGRLSGFTSIAHTQADADGAAMALAASIAMLRADGEL